MRAKTYGFNAVISSKTVYSRSTAPPNSCSSRCDMVEKSPLRLGSAAASGARPAAGSPTPRADRAPARGEKSAFEMLIRFLNLDYDILSNDLAQRNPMYAWPVAMRFGKTTSREVDVSPSAELDELPPRATRDAVTDTFSRPSSGL